MLKPPGLVYQLHIYWPMIYTWCCSPLAWPINSIVYNAPWFIPVAAAPQFGPSTPSYILAHDLYLVLQLPGLVHQLHKYCSMINTWCCSSQAWSISSINTDPWAIPAPASPMYTAPWSIPGAAAPWLGPSAPYILVHWHQPHLEQTFPNFFFISFFLYFYLMQGDF